MRVRENLIQKGIRIVDMTMMMVQSEGDTKIPGEHLVCNYYFSVSSKVFGINTNIVHLSVLGILKSCLLPIILN